MIVRKKLHNLKHLNFQHWFSATFKIQNNYLIFFFRRVASFGDPPRRRKRLKTRAERSRRAASVESSRQSSRSNGKSHDSGIALNEESETHENSPNDHNLHNLDIQEESDQVMKNLIMIVWMNVKVSLFSFVSLIRLFVTIVVSS